MSEQSLSAPQAEGSLPLVTVVIPNYNYAHYVCDAVDSALAQTYPNVEVVVSDNASTDDSWEVLQRYHGNPRVRLYRQAKTIHVGNHFNFVALMADSDHLVLLSADDMLKPQFVEKTLRVILDHPERTIGFVAAEREILDGEGHIVEHVPFYSTACIIPGRKQAKVFYMGNPFVPSQMLVNWDLLYPNFRSFRNHRTEEEWLRRFREAQAEFDCLGDCAMWMRLCLVSDFAYLPEKLSVYRQHFQGEAASHMGSLRGLFELYLLKEKFLGVARKYGLTEILDHAEQGKLKVGTDCLKWAAMFLERNDVRTARRLMHLAAAIDDGLPGTPGFRALHQAVEAGGPEPYATFLSLLPEGHSVLRRSSYDPPEGYIPLETVQDRPQCVPQ